MVARRGAVRTLAPTSVGGRLQTTRLTTLESLEGHFHWLHAGHVQHAFSTTLRHIYAAAVLIKFCCCPGHLLGFLDCVLHFCLLEQKYLLIRSVGTNAASITYLIHYSPDRLMLSCSDGLCDGVTSNIIWLAALGPNPQSLPIVYTMCCAPHQNPLSCCTQCSNTSALQVSCLNVPGHHARLLTSRFKIWLGMSLC